MKIVKEIFDAVFSVGGFMTAAGVLVILLVTAAIKQDNAEKELAVATTKACYDSGMIKVDTDAGFYCVVPSNLVKVK